jgi:hypothetical protein
MRQASCHRRSCFVSGTPMWTARQTAFSSPSGCPSGHDNLTSRYNLPLPVRQYSLPNIVARQWGRVSSSTTLALTLCHSGNAPFAHIRMRCRASHSDPPSRTHTGRAVRTVPFHYPPPHLKRPRLRNIQLRVKRKKGSRRKEKKSSKIN